MFISQCPLDSFHRQERWICLSYIFQALVLLAFHSCRWHNIVQTSVVHIITGNSCTDLISPFPVSLLVVLWERGKTTGLLSR